MVTALCSSRPPAGAAPPNLARKSGRAESPAGLSVATTRLRLVMAMLSPSNSRASNLGKWDRNSRIVAVFIVIQDCVTMPPESRVLSRVGKEARDFLNLVPQGFKLMVGVSVMHDGLVAG